MNVVHFIDNNAILGWAVLLILWVLLALWVVRLQQRARRVENELRGILTGASIDNVPKMLVDYLTTVRQTANTVEEVRREHREIASRFPTVIRHVGLVRFSPFHDTGGDQSFALALLDGRGDGVVVTALHSRNGNRLYAKPIERGRSTYALTPEEMQAMSRAQDGSLAGVH